MPGKRNGPISSRLRLCVECKWLDFWICTNKAYADCTCEPHDNKPKRIGKYKRGHDGGVPTPKWCPVLLSRKVEGE